ncbi:SGNH/GDSL hydrolase family protein [Actinomadura verrucosospora]|uniref:Putative GDSL-like lipase/acylhydrolase n=1 Tax=Actinomadura verrucosospora TaxID=46165 RepID=A0A7D3ZD85_ACTVE|nr:SGNH/GDSL hydrolase family protein [Actinomadura verrucosospora]QKG19857.1 putative GDSL-like lipase/acylhydrolase [Actinomadura verrucosospora]
MTTATFPRSEAGDPWCLTPGRAADLLQHAPWRRFATVGDSLSAGTGDPRSGYGELGWPDRVAGVLRRIRPDLAFLNVAEAGATTSRVLRTQLDRLAEFGPDLVHVPSGANDLFRTDPDYAAIATALDELYGRAAATGAQLTAFTLGRAFVVPRFPDWTDRVRRVNGIVRELAARHGAVLVDMWDHPVNDRPDLISADGVHFAAPGQAVMAAEVARGLARLLDGEARR